MRTGAIWRELNITSSKSFPIRGTRHSAGWPVRVPDAFHPYENVNVHFAKSGFDFAAFRHEGYGQKKIRLDLFLDRASSKNRLVIYKMPRPRVRPESESIPVPETPKLENPLVEVPVVAVVMVVAQKCRMMKSLLFILFLFYAVHLRFVSIIGENS
jgi:hypothetical protein